MSEIATTLSAVGGLAVAAGGLIVSVGVFYLVIRVGRAIERITDTDRNS